MPDVSLHQPTGSGDSWMNEIERASSYFEEGFSCSQAVFAAYAPQHGLDPTLALKISAPFGGGMGSMGETCGAVTGAFMTIGLKYGRIRGDDLETKEKAYGLVQQFAAQFRQRHGSILCRELLGYDVSTPEGRERVKETGICSRLCPGLVRDAAEILEGLLDGE
jgi:C_GCAxxG_C_C family probable redox protein